MNITSWGTLRSALEDQLISADVILAQEHHLAPLACVAAVKGCPKSGLWLGLRTRLAYGQWYGHH